MTDTPSETTSSLWFVTWGEHVIDPNGPKPPPRTLHERLADRINWRLADAVEFFCWGMVNPVIKFLRRLQPKMCLIEDRLRGYRD